MIYKPENMTITYNGEDVTGIVSMYPVNTNKIPKTYKDRLKEMSREELTAYFNGVWEQTESIYNEENKNK